MMMKRALAGLAVVSVIVVAGACNFSNDGQECFAATTCVDKCGGTIIKSGCTVKCEPPLINEETCFEKDAGASDASADSASDAAKADAASDAPSDSPKDSPTDSSNDGGG